MMIITRHKNAAGDTLEHEMQWPRRTQSRWVHRAETFLCQHLQSLCHTHSQHHDLSLLLCFIHSTYADSVMQTLAVA